MARKQQKNVWGFDPGKTNFAFALTEFTGTKFVPSHAGMINPVLNSMENLAEQILAFEEQLLALFAWRPPHCIAIERFMNRGKQFGDTGEYVSMMLAIVVRLVHTHYPDCFIKIVQPGVWKTAFNRMRGDPAKRVKGVPTAMEKATAYSLSEAHEFDAYMISHFIASSFIEGLSNGKAYEHLAGPAGGRSFVELFDTVSTGKKHRKRKILV